MYEVAATCTELFSAGTYFEAESEDQLVLVRLPFVETTLVLFDVLYEMDNVPCQCSRAIFSSGMSVDAVIQLKGKHCTR